VSISARAHLRHSSRSLVANADWSTAEQGALTKADQEAVSR
jgi:hypothetical protein